MSRKMALPGLILVATILFAMPSASGPADDFPEPGGVHGGTYVPWGGPPFVERETPPPPGGVFSGKPFAWWGTGEVWA